MIGWLIPRRTCLFTPFMSVLLLVISGRTEVYLPFLHLFGCLPLVLINWLNSMGNIFLLFYSMKFNFFFCYEPTNFWGFWFEPGSDTAMFIFLMIYSGTDDLFLPLKSFFRDWVTWSSVLMLSYSLWAMWFIKSLISLFLSSFFKLFFFLWFSSCFNLCSVCFLMVILFPK